MTGVGYHFIQRSALSKSFSQSPDTRALIFYSSSSPSTSLRTHHFRASSPWDQLTPNPQTDSHNVRPIPTAKQGGDQGSRRRIKQNNEPNRRGDCVVVSITVRN